MGGLWLGGLRTSRLRMVQVLLSSQELVVEHCKNDTVSLPGSIGTWGSEERENRLICDSGVAYGEEREVSLTLIRMVLNENHISISLIHVQT